MIIELIQKKRQPVPYNELKVILHYVYNFILPNI